MSSVEDSKVVELKNQLKALNLEYAKIKNLPAADRADFGKKINEQKQALEQSLATAIAAAAELPVSPIDITAPCDVNAALPELLTANHGSQHPLMTELDRVINIYQMMGFDIVESRQLDDEFHMFDSLNFAKGHPARDGYDTFRTEEGFIPPAHTSTMQHRVLKMNKYKLDRGEAIAVAVPGRVYRNEDVDATHEHTFYQVEGVYVDRGVNAGMLVATLQKFLEEYYGQKLEVRVNPFYFPFTEPSFEFSLSCPFCKDGCNICSGSRWIELLGCGMIHPNVLRAAEIDPDIYTGFAFGCGIDRLVMMKSGVEDVRYFHSGKLDFLRQF